MKKLTLKYFTIFTIVWLNTLTLSAQKLELILPVGHTTQIKSAEFSPDGRFVLTIAEDDMTALVWDVKTGRLLHAIDGHGAPINSVHYSPDGNQILTASTDRTVKVWDSSGNLLFNLEGHTDRVNSAIFSSNGKLAASVSDDSTAIIWDLSNGKLLRKLDKGYDGGIKTCVFGSGDSTLITSPMNDFNAKILMWSIATGNTKLSILPNQFKIIGIMLEPQGNILISWDHDGVKGWDVKSGNQTFAVKKKYGFEQIEFYKDGKSFLTSGGTLNHEIGRYETSTGKLLELVDSKADYSGGYEHASMSPRGDFIVIVPTRGPLMIVDPISKTINKVGTEILNHPLVRIDPFGKYIFIANRLNVKIIETGSWNKISTLKGSTPHINGVDIKQGLIATATSYNSRIWDKLSGEIKAVFPGKAESVAFNAKDNLVVTSTFSGGTVYDYVNLSKINQSVPGNDQVKYNPNGTSFISFSHFGAGANIYTKDGKKQLFSLGVGKWENDSFFSADGNFIITIGEYLGFKNKLRVWNSHNGEQISSTTFGVFSQFGSISSDNKLIASLEREYLGNRRYGYLIVLTDVATGAMRNKITADKPFNNAVFDPTGKLLIVACDDGTAKIFETSSIKLIRTLPHSAQVAYAGFSVDGQKILTSAKDDSIRLWNSSNYQTLSRFKKRGEIKYIDWDNNLLYTQNSSEIFIYDLQIGKPKLSFLAVDSTDWIVRHESGLFDASQGAMDKLYFIQGSEFIDFSQLKERYYEPGLWKKIMNGENLRNVASFSSIELPPDFTVEEAETASRKLTFINLKGGIGQITISVNGLEAIEDLRPKGFNPKQPSWTYELDLSTLSNLKKGEENLIEVRAWNEGHWVISRPLQMHFTPPETRGTVTKAMDPKTNKPYPSIYILSCGVSDYTNAGIDLKYAAKDAEAMANALQLGAKKLFGINKAYVYTLTDNSPSKPSKVNIQKAFQEISKKSSPNDVFVVYLSGHGINYGGENGDFYYLTNEAYSTDLHAYNDPAQRANATISSKELIELFKTVPSDKRVLMIDACASGKMVENLVSSRDISSSTLKALDRLRDRTGFHIITGCAADAVSYEASRFGQGVLTYSLIEGIKGASLRGNKFVDVNQLFQYAKERVPVLANGIGGIQSPQVFSPIGAQSFDIGELDDATKALIPLSKTRPIFVRSTFIDEDALEDADELGKKLDEALNDLSAKGEKASLLFVDVSKYDDGCKISGKYKKVNGTITLSYKVRCGAKAESKTITDTTPEKIIEKVIAGLQQ